MGAGNREAMQKSGMREKTERTWGNQPRTANRIGEKSIERVVIRRLTGSKFSLVYLVISLIHSFI